MGSDIKDKKLPFKEFLDKTTNLVTLFGVFNALFIYASTLENKDASQFLLPSFFVLSIFIWLELILFTLTSNDGTKKYELFFFLLCSIEVGLVWYFVETFAGLLIILAIFGIYLLLVYFLTLLLTKIFLTPLAKAKEKKRKNFIFLFMVAAMILSGLFMKISMPFIRPTIQKRLPQDVKRVRGDECMYQKKKAVIEQVRNCLNSSGPTWA